MASYLLLSSPIGGHVAPVRAVGAALVRQGHRVRMITGARFRGRIERDGISFIPWPAAADYDDVDLNASFPARAPLRGMKAVQFDLCNVFAEPMPHQSAAIRAALDAEPVQAIITELSVTGLIPLLQSGRPRPPIHVLGCTPLPVSSRDTFPYGLGLAPPSSALGRVRARLMTQLARRLVLAPVQRRGDALLRGLGLPALKVFILEWFTMAERLWQLTVPEFEYPRSEMPGNLRFAGPLLPDAGGDLPGWWGDLDGKQRVVHVTQGTLANADLSMLLGPALAGLAGEDLLVVATTGGRPVSAIPGALPANARAAEMIPYPQLLPKVDVMVTNGGYGGVQFALTHGVPLVVAGEGEDKPEIAARVAWSGIGRDLRTGRPTPQAIASAVRALLRETSYREAAAKLAARSRSTDAIETITGALPLV